MPKSYSNAELRHLASKLGKSLRTLRYWVAQNCDLEDEESVRRFVDRKAIKGRQTAKARVAREQRRSRESVQVPVVHKRQVKHEPRFETPGNGQILGPIGPRGAQHALRRLEEQEERSHARLEVALKRGDPFEIQSCADLWLKTSELLRKLDIAIEVSRRSQEETQIPLKLAQDAINYAAEWMQIAFMQLLSSEGQALMGIRDFGEWKYYAFERFRSILHLTVRTSLKTNSPIPEWAAQR